MGFCHALTELRLLLRHWQKNRHLDESGASCAGQWFQKIFIRSMGPLLWPIPVLITVDKDVLYKRLMKRAWETPAEIKQRMNRFAEAITFHPKLVFIENNNTVDQVLKKLYAMVSCE